MRSEGEAVFGEKKPDSEGWLEEARRTYDQIFGAKAPKDLLTFRQIEAYAVAQGERLTRWLLERMLIEDGAHPETWPCPHCGKPASAKEEGPEPREIIAKPGSVGFARQGYFCPSCRKVFFPSGPKVGLAVRELQPLGSRQDGVGGGELGILRPGGGGGEEVPRPAHQPEGAAGLNREVRARKSKPSRRQGDAVREGGTSSPASRAARRGGGHAGRRPGADP